jgi:metal-responsive CopG/Arc/MetJ family transcriptional regulator
MAESPTAKPFLHFNIKSELLKRVDDFRFKNRFHSRAETIQWLLNWALDQKPKRSEKDGE